MALFDFFELISVISFAFFDDKHLAVSVLLKTIPSVGQVLTDLLYGRYELSHATHGHIGLVLGCIPASLLKTQLWKGFAARLLHLFLLKFQ